MTWLSSLGEGTCPLSAFLSLHISRGWTRVAWGHWRWKEKLFGLGISGCIKDSALSSSLQAHYYVVVTGNILPVNITGKMPFIVLHLQAILKQVGFLIPLLSLCWERFIKMLSSGWILVLQPSLSNMFNCDLEMQKHLFNMNTIYHNHVGLSAKRWRMGWWRQVATINEPFMYNMFAFILIILLFVLITLFHLDKTKLILYYLGVVLNKHFYGQNESCISFQQHTTLYQRFFKCFFFHISGHWVYLKGLTPQGS